MDISFIVFGSLRVWKFAATATARVSNAHFSVCHEDGSRLRQIINAGPRIKSSPPPHVIVLLHDMSNVTRNRGGSNQAMRILVLTHAHTRFGCYRPSINVTTSISAHQSV